MMRFALCVLLVSLLGAAFAQCPRPEVAEIGGVSKAICAGVGGYQAIAHERKIRMVQGTGASPVPGGEVALNQDVRHMHTQIVGKIWAVDLDTVYGIDVSLPANPTIVGQLKLPLDGFERLSRIRVHGNRLYIISEYDRLHIVDISNQATPVLLSSYRAPDLAGFDDVEVVGSYAYITTEHDSAQTAGIVVMDISNPLQPVELNRFGNGMGLRVSTAPNNPSLYTLTRRGLNGFIERWSLADPIHPSLQATSPTISGGDGQDELLVSLNCVCLMNWFDQVGTDALRLFDLASIAPIGQPVQVPQYLTAMGIDPPYVFLGHDTGQIDRVNILNALSPAPSLTYYDPAPGSADEVVNINNGYAVLRQDRALWFFRTQSSGAATLIGHLTPSTSGARYEGPIVVINDTVYIHEWVPAAAISYIRAYRVTPSTSPYVALLGSFTHPGSAIYSFDVGDDQNLVRRIYYTDYAVAVGTLHVVNASNPAAMTHSGSISLTSGAVSPVRFLPGFTLAGLPDRVAVGGTTTQLLNVAVPTGMFPLGVIPADSSRCLVRGVNTNLWLIGADSKLRAFEIGNPATPFLLSTLQLPPYASGFRFINPFGARAGVVADDGLFVRIDTANAAAPSIVQIVKVAEQVRGFAWDGLLLHFAAAEEGYKVFPTDFDGRPFEDTNNPMRKLGTGGYLSICPGTTLSIPTHFVAIPAVSSYQWFKYNAPANTLDPIANGPTGTGSTISGVTAGTLVITNPGAADNGSYNCRATNACGTSEFSGVTARLYGYANCDNSTAPPVLNANDFQCFLNKFAAQEPWYPNCDGSTNQPTLNVNDFQCFLNEFAASCH